MHSEAAPLPELGDTIIDDTKPLGKPESSAAMTSMVSRRAFAELAILYAQYLMETGKADSREACAEQVGKFMSSGMDRGEITVNELEYVMGYIKSERLRIKTPWDVRYEFINEITQQTMGDLQWIGSVENVGFSPEESQLITDYQKAFEVYDKLRWELRDNLIRTIESTIDVILIEYKSVLDQDFVSRYSTKK